MAWSNVAAEPCAAAPCRRRAADLAPIGRSRTALRFVSTLLALLALVAPSAAPAGGALAPANGPVPPLELRDLDGRQVRLADFRGRTVLVNFWATWCAPCVQEMPSMQRLRDRYAAQGFEVLAVNYQENAARIRPFLDRHGLSFQVLRDHDGSAKSAWDVRVFPSSFVVAPDQRVALAAFGEIDWDDTLVQQRIRALLPR